MPCLSRSSPVARSPQYVSTQASTAVRELAARRQQLPRLDDAQAAALARFSALAVTQPPDAAGDAGGDALACLQLLLRWAEQLHGAARQQQHPARGAQAALSEATSSACEVLAVATERAEPWQRDLVATAILFVGTAAHGASFPAVPVFATFSDVIILLLTLVPVWAGLPKAQRLECAQCALKAAQAIRARSRDASIAQFAAGIAALLVSLQVSCCSCCLRFHSSAFLTKSCVCEA